MFLKAAPANCQKKLVTRLCLVTSGDEIQLRLLWLRDILCVVRSGVVQSHEQPVFNLFRAEVNQYRSFSLSQVVQTRLDHNVFAFTDAHRDSLSLFIDLSLDGLSLIGLCVVQRTADNAFLADSQLHDASRIDVFLAR